MRSPLTPLLTALVSSLSAAAPQEMTILEHPAPTPGARFGSAAVLMDFDRDGQLDLLVGAPGGPSGRVFVFLGPIPHSVRDLSHDLELLSPLPSPDDDFGFCLAAGDIDGDGKDELVIGAPRWRQGLNPETGAAFLYDPDSPSPWTPLLTRHLRTGRMGSSIAIGSFTDVAGLEVALGAPGFKLDSGRQEGAVHLFAQLNAGPRELILRNPNPCSCGHDTQFGHRVASGDWNGDGRQDLAVSAVFNDVFVPKLGSSWPGAGQVFVYTSPVTTTPTVTLDNPDPISDPFPAPGVSGVYQRFGHRIGFGRLGGDASQELAITAVRKDSSGASDAGRAFLYSGEGGALHPLPVVALHPPALRTEALFGYNFAFADLTGAGQLEWVVGDLNKEEAAVHVWSGAALRGDADIGPRMSSVAPPDHGAHYIESMLAGSLRPKQRGEVDPREELVLGDPDAADGAGRVVILYW